MPFPINPVDGQQATVNSIIYIYNSSKSVWNKLATTGNTIVANSLFLTNTTTSTSTSTGALVVAGGAGIDGNLYATTFFTANGIRWAGNGAVFASGGGGGGNTYTANIAPPTSGNVAGDMWYDTNSDILYEFLDDGSTKYWVDVQSLGQTGNIVSMVDTTLSGNIVVGLNDVYSIGTSTGYISNIFANVVTSNLVTVNGNITATGDIVTTQSVIATGNITATGNVVTTQSVIATGNITANYFIGDGSKLTNTVTTGKAIAMSIVFGG